MSEASTSILPATDPHIIVALDVPNAMLACEIADHLNPALCRLKVGLELFSAEGPRIVDILQRRSYEVFLDLKFNDIPATVTRAAAAAASLGVWAFNMHANCGRAAIEAASEYLAGLTRPPKLFVVTHLTSLDAKDTEEIGFAYEPRVQVTRLALLGEECGADGVICSPLELNVVEPLLTPTTLVITPGVRPLLAKEHDQKRFSTPEFALENGADYLVIGRPITQAQDPGEALKNIINPIS